MKGKARRVALIFLGLVSLALAVPAVLTWRQVRQERLNQALTAAVKRNDTAAVVSDLKLGADANCRDEPPRRVSFWQTLIQAFRGYRSLPSRAPTSLQIALKEPQDSYWLNQSPIPPAPSTIPPENVSLVRALLDHRANINQADDNGWVPLDWAISDGMNATIHLLLARGANINGQDTPLAWATRNPHIEIGVIADMLDRGADVNQRTSDGDTALFMAVGPGRVDVVRLLLARHADVNVPAYGATPLAWALDNESPQGRQIVQMLKAAGATE